MDKKNVGDFIDKLGEPRSTRIIQDLDTYAGPVTDSYSKYVRRIFSPVNNDLKSGTPGFPEIAAEIAAGNPIPDIPASLLMRMERMEESVNENEDKLRPGVFSPLEMMYDYYGKYGLEDSKYAKYPVYQPKSSSEYYSVANRTPRVGDSPAVTYKVARTASSPNVWRDEGDAGRRYKVSSTNARRFVPPSQPHHLMVDYGSFRSSPLSPYMYPAHRYVHDRDSRILGSDFVMLTLRPQDPFMNRVDKVLADAKRLS